MAFSSIIVAFLAVMTPTQAFAPASLGVKTVRLYKIRCYQLSLSVEIL
jgi:hypothetical protein